MPKIHLMIHFLLKEAYTWVQVLLNVVAQQWQPVHHCTKIQVIILNHFHEKLMKRSFKKSTKPHFGAMLGPSAQIWEKMNFHEKKGLVSFKYSNYLLWCKKQKTNEWFLEKNAELTEKQQFYKLSVGQGLLMLLTDKYNEKVL